VLPPLWDILPQTDLSFRQKPCHSGHFKPPKKLGLREVLLYVSKESSENSRNNRLGSENANCK